MLQTMVNALMRLVILFAFFLLTGCLGHQYHLSNHFYNDYKMLNSRVLLKDSVTIGGPALVLVEAGSSHDLVRFDNDVDAVSFRGHYLILAADNCFAGQFIKHVPKTKRWALYDLAKLTVFQKEQVWTIDTATICFEAVK